MRCRIYQYYLLFVITAPNLFGQNPGQKDSVAKTVTLDEVCIDESQDKTNTSFDFYKNNKLATTEDILSRMRGVNLIRRGAYGLEPSLRNYSSGQTNITLDGMRIYGACTDKMDPVSIYVEPTNLSSIQVAHGASGASNGSTIGGQINLQLKEPTFNCHTKFSGQLYQTFLSVNNAYYTSFAFQQSSKKLAYRVNGTYRKAGDYMAGGNIRVPYSGFEKYNLGLSLLYKLSENQTIKLNCIDDAGKNIGYPALPMDVGSAIAQIYSLSHIVQSKTNFFSRNELKLYYNEITHMMDDTHRSNIAMHMDMPGWTKTIGFYDELHKGEKLQIRLDYHHVYARADMIMYPTGEPSMYLQTQPQNNLNDAGLSLKYKTVFKHRQEIIINGRIDYFLQSAIRGPGYNQWKVFNTDINQDLTNILKNVNFAYSKRLGKHYQAQISTGYSERLPTSNERYGYYLFNRQDQYDYIGNIQLKPEASRQLELSIKRFTSKTECYLTLFYNYITNYIYSYKLTGLSQMTIGAYGLKTYRNIDHAISAGFEGNLQTKLTNNFTYIGNVKYIYAETYNRQPLPLIPPFKLQEALRYSKKLFQIQLEHDYAMAQKRVNLDYGDKITRSFHLFNLRISKTYRIKSTALQLTVACENIFDKNYREHLDIGQIPRFGRNFLLNVNFLF